MSYAYTIGNFEVREDHSTISHHLKDASVRNLMEHQHTVRLRVERNGILVGEPSETFVAHAPLGATPHGRPLKEMADEWVARWVARHKHGLRLDGQRKQFGLAGVSVEVFFSWDPDDFVRVRVRIPEMKIDTACPARDIVQATKDWRGVEGDFAGLLYPRVAELLQ